MIDAIGDALWGALIAVVQWYGELMTTFWSAGVEFFTVAAVVVALHGTIGIVIFVSLPAVTGEPPTDTVDDESRDEERIALTE